MTLTINDKEYKILEDLAKTRGKPLQDILSEIIKTYSSRSSKKSIRQNDPFFNIKGFDGDAPADLAANHDFYLYGK